LCSHIVLALLYSALPLTYFCGHLLNINKIILSILSAVLFVGLKFVESQVDEGEDKDEWKKALMVPNKAGFL
jgi:hypothetical protein